MIDGRWHLCLGRFPLLKKQAEELSYPFRSVQCTLVDGLKSFFDAYMRVILSLNSKYSRGCRFCFSVNSKLGTRLNHFCTGFSVAQIASLQATGVVLSPQQYSQVAQFLHSHDPHASSCLVAVRAFKFFFLSLNATLQAWSSKVFVIVFKIIAVTGRPTSSCFQYISLAGRFAVSYFVTLLPINNISVVDHLAPSCYLVELFSRLIASLRVVLFVPLRFKIPVKLLWVKIALLRYSIQIGFCR